MAEQCHSCHTRAQAALRLVAPSGLPCILSGLDSASATSINQGNCQCRDHQHAQHLQWLYEMGSQYPSASLFHFFSISLYFINVSKAHPWGQAWQELWPDIYIWENICIVTTHLPKLQKLKIAFHGDYNHIRWLKNLKKEENRNMAHLKSLCLEGDISVIMVGI